MLDEDVTTLKEMIATRPWRKNEGTKESKVRAHQALARHVLQERLRLGGDFVVAFALENKLLRDAIKEITGPDTLFVILCINEELQAKRIDHRTPWYSWWWRKFFKEEFRHFNKPAEIDEVGAFNIYITEKMTSDDIARKILSEVTKL